MEWYITNTNKTVDLGTYEGDTAKEAAINFYEDAGYEAWIGENGMFWVNAPIPLDSIILEAERSDDWEIITPGIKQREE